MSTIRDITTTHARRLGPMYGPQVDALIRELEEREIQGREAIVSEARNIGQAAQATALLNRLGVADRDPEPVAAAEPAPTDVVTELRRISDRLEAVAAEIRR